MQEYNITKDNVFLGPHTLLCTLGTWHEIGWFLSDKVMDIIKEYMPTSSRLCNMVSNYSKLQYQQQMFSIINDMCMNEELILVDSIQNMDGYGYVDIYEIPSRTNISKGEKYKYILYVQHKDIEMYIWLK